MNDTQTNNNNTATKVINALRWIGAAILPIISSCAATFLVAMILGFILSPSIFGQQCKMFEILIAFVCSGFSIPLTAYAIAPAHKQKTCIIVSSTYASLYILYCIVLCGLYPKSIQNWWLTTWNASFVAAIVLGMLLRTRKHPH